MELVRKLDDYGKPAWITLMVFAFIVFWPVGLAILFFLIGSGRMACWKHGGPGRWYYGDGDSDRKGERGGRRWRRRHGRVETSGNVAFDEYREETIRRLEDEQKEFQDFLERLRRAKDKAEFDDFMADRRTRGARRDDPDTDRDGPAPRGPIGGGPVPGGVPGNPMPQRMD